MSYEIHCNLYTCQYECYDKCQINVFIIFQAVYNHDNGGGRLMYFYFHFVGAEYIF